MISENSWWVTACEDSPLPRLLLNQMKVMKRFEIRLGIARVIFDKY
jgi:hypothetical protein